MEEERQEEGGGGAVVAAAAVARNLQERGTAAAAAAEAEGERSSAGIRLAVVTGRGGARVVLRQNCGSAELAVLMVWAATPLLLPCS